MSIHGPKVYIGSGQNLIIECERDPFVTGNNVMIQRADVIDLIKALRQRYCMNCGREDPSCQCENDE